MAKDFRRRRRLDKRRYPVILCKEDPWSRGVGVAPRRDIVSASEVFILSGPRGAKVK